MPSSGRDNFAHSKAITNDVDQRSGRIRRLNDRLRQTLIGGSVNITQGVEALGLMAVSTILYGVRQFDEFSAANDPYDEHDFGALTSAGQRNGWANGSACRHYREIRGCVRIARDQACRCGQRGRWGCHLAKPYCR